MVITHSDISEASAARQQYQVKLQRRAQIQDLFTDLKISFYVHDIPGLSMFAYRCVCDLRLKYIFHELHELLHRQLTLINSTSRTESCLLRLHTIGLFTISVCHDG